MFAVKGCWKRNSLSTSLLVAATAGSGGGVAPPPPPPSSLRTYKQTWISTTTATTGGGGGGGGGGVPVVGPANFSIRWETPETYQLPFPQRQRTSRLLLFVSNPSRRHRHLQTALPVLLQTETLMNGAAGDSERLFHR